ncbi:outer membrane efflux protein [Desulfosarcina variabilis str. Montpellier]|uniref:TolC family protein n=1 Tax=Desulfosarcina variabilis TaxID=2300 RepID=UPI003AFB7458
MAVFHFRLTVLIVLGGLTIARIGWSGVDEPTGRPSAPSISITESNKPEETLADASVDRTDAPIQVPDQPLTLSVSQAILMCLENNRSLMVERLNPTIVQTFEDQARADFDPVVSAQVSVGREQGERLARSGSATEEYNSDTAEGMISLAQYFPTGTTLAIEAGTQITDSSLYLDRLAQTRLGMTVNQALLSGLGTDVNLVQLQQARLDTRMTEYALRGFTESLVADVENTYWDFALARRQIEIVDESLKVARQQLAETRQLIDVGRLAKSELAAVQAEVASQEQARIEAVANMERIRLQLLRLLNPPGPAIWQREITLVHPPALPDIPPEAVDTHVAVAMRLQPLLNEARLQLVRGDLELVKTRNGLLPLLDLFITLGKSGYADSFGESIRHMDEDRYDAQAGIKLDLPVFNRSAKALHKRALSTRQQLDKALSSLTQLVEIDVRTAYIEVGRTKQQISASSVTRRFDEEKLRTETERLRVGKSTSFMVAQAQRDLLSSRIAEVRALVNYLKALTDLYRQDGSLLRRRGVSAPGQIQVDMANK